MLLLVAAAACQTEREPQLVQSVPGGDAERGPAIIRAYGCQGCHEIPGIRSHAAHVGPPLTDYALRAYVAGSLPNRAEHLVRWIRDPQSIQPGTAMPTLGVSEADARHIAAYLYTLR